MYAINIVNVINYSMIILDIRLNLFACILFTTITNEIVIFFTFDITLLSKRSNQKYQIILSYITSDLFQTV